MAAPKQKKRTTTRKRRERKNDGRGQVHIHSSLTIPSLPSRTWAAMQFPGLAPAAGFRGSRKARRLPRRPQRKRPPRLQKSMACVPWKCM